MKKLRLDLDQLTVETFDTREADAARPGTVHGAEQASCGNTCESCPSACGSCDETCTCPFTYESWRVNTELSCVDACPVCWI